ncbi:MAG TPA: phosphotransferase [Candidatus Binatia bacterium]|jgi:hypothetical protein|nr:phosphotransferase [Candidatus Binatia bacterium]
MDTPLTNTDQATPEWLTGILQKKGFLPHGEVVRVQQKSPQPLITSLITHLELSYSDDVPTSAPTRLFLKVAKPGLDPQISSQLGKNEVEFYNTTVALIPNPPVVRCYDAVYSPETGQWHVLLEDVSDTHFQTEWPLPPSLPHCERVMECLAKFHAFWWEHPRLGHSIGELPTEVSLQEVLRDVEQRCVAFVDFLGDRLSLERRHVYEKVLASLPQVWERYWRERVATGKGLTLIHGDAHLWSFMYPHNPDTDTIRIIDWQSWRIRRGTDDLAYMIALHWYPERRHALERDLIRKYHAELPKQEVKNYDWDECWYNYRLSVIGNLFIPVWQWSVKIWAGVWWPHLERAILAFEDLQCAELLEN